MQNNFHKILLFGLTLVAVFAVSGLLPQRVMAQAGYCQLPGVPTAYLLNESECRARGGNWQGATSQTPTQPGQQTFEQSNPAPSSVSSDGGSFFSWLNPAKWLGWTSLMILQVANFVLWLSGVLLNTVIQYTVVNMSDNISDVKTINNAWQVIRDLSNIGFIFVLLYAAIETIIGKGKDNQGLIVKIVVVAVLVNFSLFFTQFVIDASNVIAIMFYDAIAPNSLEAGASGAYSGIANSLMEPLKIQTLWQTTSQMDITGRQLIIIGVMGTIVSLIAAFVFFAVALMFIIRFVVLIFVLVLSPIAFVSFVLPKMDQYRKQWWDALSGQAFFAPIYFLLTWIVIVIARGMFDTSTEALATAFVGTIGPDGRVQPGHVTVIMNFIIIIAMLIFSLTTAKEWASKGGAVVGKMTSWATGAAGGMTLGMAGRFGRGTFGRLGAGIASSERVKNTIAEGGVKGWFAKGALYGGQKSSKATFDVRGAGFASGLDAGKPKKGGFAQDVKDRTKSQKDLVKTLRAVQPGASDEEKAAAKDRAEQYTRSRAADIFGTKGMAELGAPLMKKAEEIRMKGEMKGGLKGWTLKRWAGTVRSAGRAMSLRQEERTAQPGAVDKAIKDEEKQVKLSDSDRQAIIDATKKEE